MKWANGFVNGHSLRPELNCIFSVQVCLGEVIYIAVELALNNFLVSDHAGLYLWEGLGFNPLQSRNSRPLAAPVIPTKVFRGLTETWETRRALGVHRRTACQKAQSLHPRCSTCTLTTYQSLSHCVADLPMQVICCAMQAKSFAELECVLTADIARITRYCQQWRLKPIVSKTVASTFHLQNTRAAHELTVLMNGQRLKHDFTPVYLGFTLDRSLFYKTHLSKTAGKLKTRNNRLSKLAGTTWGAGAHTFRTTALALCYSVAEYCCQSSVPNLPTATCRTYRHLASLSK